MSQDISTGPLVGLNIKLLINVSYLLLKADNFYPGVSLGESLKKKKKIGVFASTSLQSFSPYFSDMQNSGISLIEFRS